MTDFVRNTPITKRKPNVSRKPLTRKPPRITPRSRGISGSFLSDRTTTSTISLKAANGKYVEPGASALDLVATGTDPTDPAVQLTIEPQPNDQCAIKQNGVYWSAQLDGTMQANRETVGLWETFKQAKGQRTGSIALLSVYLNTYVTAPLDGSALTCRNATADDWQSFDVPPGEVIVLDPLGVTGFTFANGWQYRGASDFRLLRNILDGQDVTPILQQRKDAGANILRVLTMAGNLFALDPDTYSDDDFTKAVTLVNNFGLRLELVALADCAQPLTKPLSWQQSHLARVGRIAGTLNLCELGNEINNFYQNVDPSQFIKPAGCLSSRGSTTGYQNYCPLPAWDYSTIHGDRDEKWLLNIAKAGLDLVHGFGGYAGTQGPLVHNEPNKSPYPLTTPEDWFIAGNQGAVWRAYGIGGIAFHCDSSLQSLLWNDTEFQSAKQCYKGLTQGTNA